MARGSPFTAKIKTYYQSIFGLSTQSSKWSSKHGDHDIRNENSGLAGQKIKHYKNLSENSSDNMVLTSITSGDRSQNLNRTEVYPMGGIAVEHHVNVV